MSAFIPSGAGQLFSTSDSRKAVVQLFGHLQPFTVLGIIGRFGDHAKSGEWMLAERRR
jgi:hypothetical protein